MSSFLMSWSKPWKTESSTDKIGEESYKLEN